jgi:cellulose biosynthesis protein BcsQ
MYDFVVVDTPPLLAFTDGAVVAAQCDGVVLVARSGKVRSDELESAVASLQKVGARILGPMFTFVPVPRPLKRTIKTRIQRRGELGANSLRPREHSVIP